MPKQFLSDEEIFSTLENVVNAISKKVPLHHHYQHPCKFPDKEIFGELQQQGYNPKMSWAFLHACYWHLRDQKVLDIDPSLKSSLTKEITEDRKTDFCMEIFSEYEIFLKANYERSLIEPNPYLKPEKTSDSSPGFQYAASSGGK